MVHRGGKEKRRLLLSIFPCKLGSGKTRRKEDMKEEPTPYHGADSLKQIQFFSTSVQIYQISTYRTVTVHTSYIGTPLFACSRPQEFLRHFRGCQLQDFVPNAVAALPFANVVKVSDNPHLSIEKSWVAPLFLVSGTLVAA